AAADSEKTGQESDGHTGRHEAPGDGGIEAHIGIAAGVARIEHRQRHRQHHQAEQEEEMLAVDQFAEARAQRRASDARDRKHDGTGPLHIALPRMGDQVGESIDRHGKRAGPDRDMRRAHADDIDQERHGEDRAAAAEQTEREADDAAGAEREEIRGTHAGARFHGIAARSLAMPHQPETPANTRPHPTKADSRMNQGDTAAPRARPVTTSVPAAICTCRCISIGWLRSSLVGRPAAFQPCNPPSSMYTSGAPQASSVCALARVRLPPWQWKITAGRWPASRRTAAASKRESGARLAPGMLSRACSAGSRISTRMAEPSSSRRRASLGEIVAEVMCVFLCSRYRGGARRPAPPWGRRAGSESTGLRGG